MKGGIESSEYYAHTISEMWFEHCRNYKETCFSVYFDVALPPLMETGYLKRLE
jgi:hypothetical protein